MKTALVIVIVAILAGVGGWFIGRTPTKSPASTEKKVAYYQSSMHPWIRSDKPGNCTICGMKLTPVYEGEKGFEADGDIVALSSNSIQVLNVATEPATVRPLTRSLRVAGRIEADETRYRVISAYVDGRIEELFINYTGAEVLQGQELVRLYSPALQTAQREYLNLRAQTNFAVSPQLKSEHEQMVRAAEVRLKRLGLTEEQIREMPAATNDLFTSVITAPISGTVVKRDVVEGQYVREGDNLLEIADLSVMWFRFDVYEQDLSMIQLGQSVAVSSAALGNRVYSGPITFIEPTVNERTRSARVRVELENPRVGTGERSQRALYNGLYAEGTIQIQTDPVLAVPESAVLHPGDHPRVYVDNGGGAYEIRVVQLGRKGDRFWEIRSGVEQGEEVVTNGNLMIDSQAQINRTGSAHSHGGETQMPGNQPPGASTEHQHLSEGHVAHANAFVKFVSGLSAALAADDLQAYNRLAEEKASEEVANIRDGMTDEHSSTGLLNSLHDAAARLGRAPNLDAARKQFEPFSAAAVKLVQHWRSLGSDIGAKTYRCPMYPKMGQNAFWVQQDGPLRNPFYGSEMLECGQEIK